MANAIDSQTTRDATSHSTPAPRSAIPPRIASDPLDPENLISLDSDYLDASLSNYLQNANSEKSLDPEIFSLYNLDSSPTIEPHSYNITFNITSSSRKLIQALQKQYGNNPRRYSSITILSGLPPSYHTLYETTLAKIASTYYPFTLKVFKPFRRWEKDNRASVGFSIQPRYELIYGDLMNAFSRPNEEAPRALYPFDVRGTKPPNLWRYVILQKDVPLAVADETLEELKERFPDGPGIVEINEIGLRAVNRDLQTGEFKMDGIGREHKKFPLKRMEGVRVRRTASENPIVRFVTPQLNEGFVKRVPARSGYSKVREQARWAWKKKPGVGIEEGWDQDQMDKLDDR